MGNYDPLRDYLMGCDSDEAVLSFARIEEILGRALPASARKYDAWWANVGDGTPTQHSHARSWNAAGYRARVDRAGGTVVFYRAAQPSKNEAASSLAVPGDGGQVIALIASAGQQQDEPGTATEMYAPGTLFSLSCAYARTLTDRIYMLSAKHGLVSEDAGIEPHEETLNNMSADGRRAWAEGVLSQLGQVCDLQRDQFIILAGRDEYEYLLPGLANVTLPLGNLPLGKRIELLHRLNTNFEEAPSGAEGAALWLHRLFERLPRYEWRDIDAIPFENGIAIVYERGETYRGLARVVRVDAHTAPGQLKQRLMDHFDRENRNASTFRKDIGSALLNRAKDPYLDIWSLDTFRQSDRDREDARTAAQMERDVSAYMRVNLSFSVIPVAAVDSRLRLGEAIVATLRQAKDFAPSDGWLGHYSPELEIRASGLWQKRALDAVPLTADESLLLARIIVPGM